MPPEKDTQALLRRAQADWERTHARSGPRLDAMTPRQLYLLAWVRGAQCVLHRKDPI